MRASSSIATTATAPSSSTSSRVTSFPPGILTRSLRRAKIFPVCRVSDDVVSKMCSATGNRFGLGQRLGYPVMLFTFVRRLFGDLHRQTLGCFVVDRRPDEANE